MKEGRKILEEYFGQKKYLFHGTEKSDIEIFKPFQAYNDGKKDGDPAIFADESIEIPIFFAIFNHKDISLKSSGFGVSESDGKIELRATKNKIDFFKKNKIFGYVYVFEKKFFHKRKGGSTGLVCEKNLKPVCVVKVSNKDIVLDVKEIIRPLL